MPPANHNQVKFFLRKLKVKKIGSTSDESEFKSFAICETRFSSSFDEGGRERERNHACFG